MEKQMSDDQIKEILKNSKTIAMIGVSSEKKGEDPKNENIAIETIEKIEKESHLAGLTEHVENFLKKKTGKKIELKERSADTAERN